VLLLRKWKEEGRERGSEDGEEEGRQRGGSVAEHRGCKYI